MDSGTGDGREGPGRSQPNVACGWAEWLLRAQVCGPRLSEPQRSRNEKGGPCSRTSQPCRTRCGSESQCHEDLELIAKRFSAAARLPFKMGHLLARLRTMRICDRRSFFLLGNRCRATSANNVLIHWGALAEILPIWRPQVSSQSNNTRRASLKDRICLPDSNLSPAAHRMARTRL